MSKPTEEEQLSKQDKVLHSIRTSRIILPILLGVAVVVYLLYKHFDPAKFAEIDWTQHTFFWIGLSLFLLIIRHLAYAWRLRVLSEKDFSWSKCIELIFIWEFSSAVSPTSVGGSAVALFVLAQEKLAAARVAAIVLYSAVVDTIFFVGTLPFLLLIFGPNIIRPDLHTFDQLDGWGVTFVGAYFFMLLYGFVFFYGLFIDPSKLKQFFVWVTKFGFLKKYKEAATQLGNDFVLASRELSKKGWGFRFGAFFSTAIAWSCRFLLLNCLIIAFTDVATDLWTQGALYARLQTMFVIIAFSPTPGGAGFVEGLFGEFLIDYVSDPTVSIVIAVIWRLFTYYFYLLMGAVIIPNWIRNRINARNQAHTA